MKKTNVCVMNIWNSVGDPVRNTVHNFVESFVWKSVYSSHISNPVCKIVWASVRGTIAQKIKSYKF